MSECVNLMCNRSFQRWVVPGDWLH